MSDSIMLECWPCKKCLSKPWKLFWWKWTWDMELRPSISSKHKFVHGINDYVRWKHKKLFKTKAFTQFVELLWKLPNWDRTQL